MLAQTQVLAMFQGTGALLNGHFLLSSGLHSAQYLQCALVLQYPEHAEKLGRALAERFASDKIDTVIAPALGGLVIGYEVARTLKAKFIFTEQGESGHKLRRGFSIKPRERLIIIEDVVTTGGSSQQVAGIVKEYRAEVVGFGAIADRTNGCFGKTERFESLMKLSIPVFKAQECPLCKDNIPWVKPGSSKKK